MTHPSLGRRLYDGWLVVAACFGEVQTLLVVTLVYVFAIGPAAVIGAIGRADFLKKRGLREPGSAWSDADSVARPDLERAKRLF